MVRGWVEAWVEREAEKEGQRLIADMMPSEDLSYLLANFSMSGYMIRMQEKCPLLWTCLRSSGRRSKQDGESLRRNRDLVRAHFFC